MKSALIEASAHLRKAAAILTKELETPATTTKIAQEPAEQSRGKKKMKIF